MTYTYTRERNREGVSKDIHRHKGTTNKMIKNTINNETKQTGVDRDRQQN